MHSVLLLKCIFSTKILRRLKPENPQYLLLLLGIIGRKHKVRKELIVIKYSLNPFSSLSAFVSFPPHSSFVWLFCWDLCEGPGWCTFISSKEGQSVGCHFRNSKWAWPLLNKTRPYFKTSRWKCLLDKGHAKIRQFVYKGFLMKMREVFFPELFY